MVGVSAATATTVATGTVTTVVFVAGTAGVVSNGVDTIQAINDEDYNQAALSVGMLGGGFLVGVSGGGQYMENSMPGANASAAPKTWNPKTILIYEAQNVYELKLGPPGLKWMATAPTPASGGGAAMGSTGTVHTPGQVAEVAEAIDEIVGD